MGRHGAREQKRLAKKKAKKTAERRALARRESDNPVIRFRDADHWPIVETLVPDNLWEQGIGQLVIARRTLDGTYATGIFLVDVFCLGIKDCFWRMLDPAEYRAGIEKIGEHGELKPVSPEYFSKLVHCAADYAQSFGFPPHRDFRHVRLLFAGIDPSLCREEFEFGKDGAPFYIRGPYESMEDARSIANRLRAVGGRYIIPVESPPDEF